MFRLVRFCYFLTNKSLKLKNCVGPTNLLNTKTSLASIAYKSPFDEFDIDNSVNCTPVFSETEKYCVKTLTSDTTDINWDEYFSDPNVPKESAANIHALVLITCQKKNFHQCAISFFLYLWRKKEITAGLLYLFCNQMLLAPDKFTCCEPLIWELFKNLVPCDRTSSKICANVLLQRPKYSDAVYEYLKKYATQEKYHNDILTTLIKANKINEALDAYVHNNVKTYWIEKKFLDHFIQEAAKGVHIGADIIRFLNETMKIESYLTLPDENVALYKILFEKMNALDENYNWLASKGVSNAIICPVCKWKFEKTGVTDEEIKKLLKDMQEKVIFQENINMKSSLEEWKKFCEFIENKEYNLVMDALNVKCFMQSYASFRDLMNNLTFLGLYPLILARVHFSRWKEYKLITKQNPVFLTENLSDDDVFVLYAALKKGKGCFTLSNDNMKFCNDLLSKQNSDIFRRWQVSHQCKMATTKNIIFPSCLNNGLHNHAHCGKDEFTHHYISNLPAGEVSVFCLRRVKKN